MPICSCVSLQVTSCVLSSQLWRHIRSYLDAILAWSLIWVRRRNPKNEHPGNKLAETMNLLKIFFLSSHLNAFILFSSNRNNLAVCYYLASSNWLILKGKRAFLIVSGSLQVLFILFPHMWETYANIHISTLGFKIILHFGQENKKEGRVQKLFWMWSYANPSAHWKVPALCF